MEEERIINIERWDYASSLNGDRVKKLQAAPPFEEITAEIKEKMDVLCFHPEKCDDEGQFKRADYCISVGNKLFDWFFNSVNGYRAAYFWSPYDGLKANEYFIQSLMPKLLLASDKIIQDTNQEFIENSLKSSSAKAWLVEENGLECSFCAAEWGNPRSEGEDKVEIANNKWEHKENPKYGRKVPYLTKIRIVGAFLNKHYQPYDPKPQRPNEIHDKGWT